MIIWISDARVTFELHKYALVNEKLAFYWMKKNKKQKKKTEIEALLR